MSSADRTTRRLFALEVVRQLQGAGYQAYWAGGCVRDRLLAREPKDYDVATAATPDQIRALFDRRRTLAIGAAFGVICVLGPVGAGQVEVTTFRSDASYSDGRRPDAVVFSSAEVDAQRRDFTINGLFYDPIAEQMHDFVGGRHDLEQGLVRAIGDPAARFREDKLRLLRAVRFAATFGFHLEPQTFAAVKVLAHEIHAVSAERISEEMRRMLAHPSRGVAARLLAESGLLAAILPEMTPLTGDDPSVPAAATTAWNQTLAVLDQLQSDSFACGLAALLHQVSRDPAFVAHLGRRWKLSLKEIEQTSWLLARLDALAGARQAPWSNLQPLLVHEGIGELLALHAARARVRVGELADAEFVQAQLQRPAAELNPPPLLTGDDLIEHGVPRGKEYKHLLEAVRAAQLDQLIQTRAEALALVDRRRQPG
ncbi:MAG TPA: CCA tRNA nucleotidyltransferase [Pirellulales bacterium]|jgi:tRNA nucleotidyltransferase/poly(A) polymerase|nr:CCA tRNA nucleotidyltransferase [Pirellulales bacterium]